MNNIFLKSFAKKLSIVSLSLVLAITSVISPIRSDYTKSGDFKINKLVVGGVNALEENAALTISGKGGSTNLSLRVETDDPSITNRGVKITLPKGLKQLSGTGVQKVNSNGTIQTKAYSIVENAIYKSYPKFEADVLEIAGSSRYMASGSLTYHFKDVVAGNGLDDLILNFEADTEIYDFSDHMPLGDIIVEVFGDGKESTISRLPVTLNGTREPKASVSVDSWEITNNNIISVGITGFGSTNGAIYNTEFDLIYPKSATISGSGIIESTRVEEGEFYRVRIKGLSKTNTDNAKFWNGTIIFESDIATNTPGTNKSVRVENMSWEEYPYQPSQDVALKRLFKNVINTSTSGNLRVKEVEIQGTSSNVQRIKQQNAPLMHLTQFKLWNKNVIDSISGSRYNLSFNFDVEKDNVRQIRVQAKGTSPISQFERIVIEYTDGTSTILENPQSISAYLKPEPGKSERFIIDAEAGKVMKSALITYNHWRSYNNNPENRDYLFDVYGSHNIDLGFSEQDRSRHTLRVYDHNNRQHTFLSAGFKWNEDIFDLVMAGKSFNLVDDGYGIDYKLGEVTVTNRANGESDTPLVFRVNVDSKDRATRIDVPMTKSFDNVESFEYTLLDGTVVSWVKGDDLPQNVVVSDNRLVFKAGLDNSITTVDVRVSKWSIGEPETYFAIYGQPVERNITTQGRSNHQFQIFTVNPDDTLTWYNGNTQGFSWRSSDQKEIVIRDPWYEYWRDGNERTFKAGDTITLGYKYFLSYNTDNLSRLVFGIALPDGAELNSTKVTYRGKQLEINEPVYRELTAQEKQSAGFSANSKAKIATFTLTNDDIQESGGTDRYIYVNASIKTSPFSTDARYLARNLIQVGTTQRIKGISTWYQHDTAHFKDIFNIGGNNQWITAPPSKYAVRVQRNPRAFIDQAVKNGDGPYKTYDPVLNQNDVDFTKSETGTLKMRAATAIAEKDVTRHDSYFYIPIPKKGLNINNSLNPSGAFKFDMFLTGDAQITSGSEFYESAVIEYATLPANTNLNSGNIDSLNFTTSWNADTNVVRVKFDKLVNGEYVDIEIPFIVTDMVSNTKLSNRLGSLAIGALSGSVMNNWSGEQTQVNYLHREWNVNFNTLGGTPVPTDQVVENNGLALEPLDAPQRWGYDFVGWYQDRLFTNEWIFSQDQVTEDVTLYARYSLKEYTVTFDPLDKGTLVGLSPQLVYHNQTISENVSIDEGENYSFIGWTYEYTDSLTGETETLSTQDPSTVQIIHDTVFTALYAKKPAITATISSGGIAVGETLPTEVKETPFDFKEFDVMSETETKDAYILFDAKDDETEVASITITDKQHDYVGTLDLTKSGVQTIEYDGISLKITYNPDANTIYIQGLASTINVDVKLKKLSTHYTVKFYFESIKDGDGNSTYVEGHEKVVSPAEAGSVPNENGTNDSFVGFTHLPNLTTYHHSSYGETTTISRVEPDGTLVIKAYYSRDSYTVKYVDEDVELSSLRVQYEETLDKPTAPSRYGYSFKGWKAQGSDSYWVFNNVDNATKVRTNLTLEADWELNEYEVTFDAGTSGSLKNGNPVTVTHGAFLDSEVEVVANSNYVFKDWTFVYQDETGEEVEKIIADLNELIIISDSTLSANYVYKPLLTAVAEDGFVGINLGQDAPINKVEDSYRLEVPSDFGDMSAVISFKGATEYKDLVSIEIVVNGKSGLVALNDPNTQSINIDGKTYQAILDRDNGLLNLMGMTVDTLVKFNYNETKTVYKVEHYFEDYSGEYVKDANETKTHADAVKGSVATFDTITKDHYIYVASQTTYSSSSVEATKDALVVQGDGSLVISLYYKLDTHAVTFDGSNQTVNIKHGQKVSAITPKEKEGYDFIGWYTDKELTNSWDFENDLVEMDLTLYPRFDIKVYTVKYENSDASKGLITNSSSESVEHGSKPQRQVSVVENDGFSFIGWSYEKFDVTGQLVSSMTFNPQDISITQDTTFTAMYAKKPSLSAIISSGQVAVGEEKPTDLTDRPYDFYEFDVMSETEVKSGWILFDHEDILKVKEIKIVDKENDFEGSIDISITGVQELKYKDVILKVTYDADGKSIYIEGLHSTVNVDINLESIITSYKFDFYVESLKDEEGNTSFDLTDTLIMVDVAGKVVSDVDPEPIDGYTFEPIFTTYTSDAVPEGTLTPIRIEPDGTLVINLYFSRNEYVLTYQGDGVDIVAEEVQFEQSIKKPKDPVRYAYTFKHWVIEGTDTVWNFEGSDNPDLIQGDTVLEAVWELNEYMVTFDQGDHGTLNNATDEYVLHGDQAQTEVEVIPHDNYVHNKWSYTYTNENGETITEIVNRIDDVAIISDAEFVALYEYMPLVTVTGVNAYVAFDSKDLNLEKEDISTRLNPLDFTEGMSVDISYQGFSVHHELVSISVIDSDKSVEIKAESVAQLMERLIELGYEVSYDSETQSLLITNITKDLDVVVEFDLIQTTYVVEHYYETLDGGFEINPDDTDVFTDIISGSEVELILKNRVNYKFNADMTLYSDSATKADRVELVVASDGSLKVQLFYNLVTHQVTFSGEDVIVEVKHGDKVTFVKPQDQESMVFAGWYQDAELTIPWNFDTDTVDGDLTLYPKWITVQTPNTDGNSDKPSMGGGTKLPSTGMASKSMGGALGIIGLGLLFLIKRPRKEEEDK